MLVAVISVSLLTLFVALVNSSVVAKREAVALSLANNQMEYMKSLPYNSLSVGSPSSSTQKVNGVTYTIKTQVQYADDAYDGCGSYPTQALKEQYCRNYPPPTNAPATDTNPADYKNVDVTVTGSGGTHLAELNTQIAARVAETASTTGALFVTVIDDNGNPITDATVNITNNTVNPVVNQTFTTDQNGIVIAYNLTPDSGRDYVISASKSGYSSLTTLAASGTLQPTYPNQSIITQASSSVTLTLKPEGSNSLVIEATDTSGNPIPGAKIYVKGGYKQYTSSADTSYYYDTMSPSDIRPTTDSSGLAALTNLVPGTYIFCGDDGDSNCKVGSTTYYVAAAVPYGGTTVFNPILVPAYSAANPPSASFSYGGTNYLQKVRLMLTTSSSFPRVNQLSPYEVSLSSGNASSFGFTLSGTNLTCSASAGSCATSVKFVQGANSYIASCTGDSSGTQLSCTVDMSAATAGNTQIVVSNSGGTLTVPSTLTLGGLIVSP